MKSKQTYIFIISGIFLLVLAGGIIFLIFFKDKFQKSKPLARANSKYLYYSDVKALILPGTPAADSIDMINRFVENWLKKQSLINRASNQGKYNDKEIEQKITDYKDALLVYDFEKKYIKAKLDTVISEKEINNYYKSNLSNFELRQNIVKAWLIKLPANAPKLTEIKNIFSLGKDKKKIESYCSQFALNFSLDDSLWKDFDQLIIETPFQENQNKLQCLQQNKFSEVSFNNAIFLLRIFELKKSSQTSPLEFVQTQIKDIIINKRKVELTQKLEKEVYEQAKNEKKIEVYVK